MKIKLRRKVGKEFDGVPKQSCFGTLSGVPQLKLELQFLNMTPVSNFLALVTVLFVGISFTVLKDWAKKKVSGELGEKQSEEIASSCVSGAQALLVACLSLCFLISGSDLFVEIAIATAGTTFVFELLTTTLRRDMVIHHLISIALGVILLAQAPNINYPLYGKMALIEISSFFLNVKYILKIFMTSKLSGSLKDSKFLAGMFKVLSNGDLVVDRIYSSTRLLFILTFFLFRLCLLPYLLLGNRGMFLTNPFTGILFLLFVALNLAWGYFMLKKEFFSPLVKKEELP